MHIAQIAAYALRSVVGVFAFSRLVCAHALCVLAECCVCFFWPFDAGQAFFWYLFVCGTGSLGCVQDGRRTGRDGRCWEVHGEVMTYAIALLQEVRVLTLRHTAFVGEGLHSAGAKST